MMVAIEKKKELIVFVSVGINALEKGYFGKRNRKELANHNRELHNVSG